MQTSATSREPSSATLLLEAEAVPPADPVHPSGGSAAAALAVLHRQHVEILSHIQKLRLMANLPDSGRSLHLVLLQLRASVCQHLACEDNLLYAVLRHHGEQRVRTLMTACSEEVRAQAAVFTAFTRRWLGPGQTREYPLGFCRDLERVTDALRQRIQHEEQQIFPFIIKHLSAEGTP